jgi:hypothetical protein
MVDRHLAGVLECKVLAMGLRVSCPRRFGKGMASTVGPPLLPAFSSTDIELVALLPLDAVPASLLMA